MKRLIRDLFSRQRSGATRKEPEMSEDATPPTNPTPPAASVDVEAIVRQVTEQVTGAVSKQLEQVSVLAASIETLTQGQQALNEKLAQQTAAPDEDALKSLITGVLDARDQASKESAEKTAARQATIDKLVTDKLGGNANLAKLLTGQTDDELAAQAELIAAEAAKLKPGFEPGKNDGGTPPNGNPPPSATPLNGASPGVAAFAQGIKMPGAAPKAEDAKASDTGNSSTPPPTDAK